MAVTGTTAIDKDAGKTAGRGQGSSGPLERVTVNLTARSSQALEEATALSADTKTDIINRALQIYAYLERVRASGGSVHVRRTEDAELERIMIF